MWIEAPQHPLQSSWQQRTPAAAGPGRGTLLLLAAIIGSYVAASVILSGVTGREIFLAKLNLGYLLLILPVPPLLLVWGCLRAVRSNPADQHAALRAAWQTWRVRHAAPSIATILLLPMLMAAFTSLKVMIPLIQPFAWDERLAHWDRSIHGSDPWELLHPLLGTPLVTFALNALYYPLWLYVSLGSWVVVAMGQHARREQFLITYVMLWILLGTVGGMAMSSAGPIFYDAVTGDRGTFSALREYLVAANDDYPLFGLAVRDRLWEAYLAGTVDVGRGISAMPSLHVAIATLCTIFAWHCSRSAGVMMTAYAVTIFATSIHLGWHYAVDGYVAILATILVWIAVGKLAQALRWAG